MNQRKTTKHFLIAAICSITVGSCMNPIQQSNSLTIATSSGVTQGILNKKVITWEDIPYAISPTGDLRWKAPRALVSPKLNIEPQEGNGCLQEASIYAGIPGEGIVGQEDCLYLDIKSSCK
jgi:para-nitrobenzyl esterase